MCCKSLAGTLVFVLLSMPVQAIEKMYGVLSLGYSDAEFSSTVEDSYSYKLVVGHQFHRQWYVEGGYYQIADEEDSDEPWRFKADALYLGVLGKASHAVGELFYRLGVASVNVQAIEAGGATACPLGDWVSSLNGVAVCEYDEAIAAGLLGIGFDYYVATKTFIRFEGEYMRGENGWNTSVFSIGLRYNFN